MNYIAFSILLISVVWVYFDARRINQDANQLGVTINLIPGLWALLTLVFWIIFFPMYLYTSTKARILLNQQYPQGDTKMAFNRFNKLGGRNDVFLVPTLAIIILLGVGWGIWAYLNRLPDCANEETQSLLKDIVRIELAGTDNPKLLEHFNTLVKVDIGAVEALKHSKDPERYVCAAQVKVDLGPEVQSVLGISQETIDNPNLFTALIMGPALQQVYGPLENLRVGYTSSWATDQNEKRHLVTAELSNKGATGYATLTEMAWARMQAKKAEAQKQTVAAAASAQASVTPPVVQPVKPEPQKVPEVNGDTLVRKASANWLTTMSKAQTGDEIAALYAPQVDFYGKINVSRESIAREKSAFVQRWSQRRYQSLGVPQLTGSTKDTLSWTQAFNFEVSDGTKSRSGESKLAFTAKLIGDDFLIISENKVD